jgi:broad specificity phosphatase PhoE
MTIQIPPHPTQLYLIRHGEVEERCHKVFGGSRMDIALSPNGHTQAAAVGRWFSSRQPDALYASPMLRVQQTIAPLAGQLPHQPVIMPDLREVDFGDWTGLKWHEIAEKFHVSAFDWLDVIDGPGIPGGESTATLQARILPCLQQVLDESAGRTAAIACHGGVIRAMLAALLGLRLPQTAHFNIEYASITSVRLHPEKKHRVEIELLNFCPWRDESAL